MMNVTAACIGTFWKVARFPEAVFSPDRLTGQLALAGQKARWVFMGSCEFMARTMTSPCPRRYPSRTVASPRLRICRSLRQVGHEETSSTFLLHVNETVDVEMCRRERFVRNHGDRFDPSA